MNIKRHIPNALTLFNLLSGVLAIFYLFMGKIEALPYFVMLSLLADFLDGLVARALKVSSPIGKELDSLADMVSFGVLPGIIMVFLVSQSLNGGNTDISFIETIKNTEGLSQNLLLFSPLLITLFSALRLAKFNVSTDQSEEFIGLATPASTIFIIGLLIAYISNNELLNFLNHAITLNLISIVLSLLLVSHIPMFSFKLRSFGLSDNKWQIIFLACSMVLIAIFKLSALTLVICLYVLLNIVRQLIKSK